MKFGAHSYLFTDRWADDRLSILDTVRDLGLDTCEISVGDDVFFTPSLTRRRAEELELELSVGPGGAWPLACDLSSEDPEERRKGLAWHQRQVELAGELGAVAYCGALYGHPGVVKRRRPRSDEFAWAAEGLSRLAEFAERRGVRVVLEPMSHFRTHLVNTPEQAMRLLDAADHANLWVLLDTYHLVTEIRDYAGAVRTAGDRLWSIHACENDRGVPGGGLVPWGEVFAALGEIAFDGRVLFETYNSSIGDFAFERGLFHDVCPDGAAFVREALAFVRQGLAVGGVEGEVLP